MKFRRDGPTGLYVLDSESGSLFYNPNDGLLIQVTADHDTIKHGSAVNLDDALEKAKKILTGESEPDQRWVVQKSNMPIRNDGVMVGVTDKTKLA